MRLVLHRFGAGIRALYLPYHCQPLNVVLGYGDPGDYRLDPFYMGSTLGRYANRIAHARLSLQGEIHSLVATPGQQSHCLHGGARGFSHLEWRLADAGKPDEVSFTLDSEHGDQGFPGRLESCVTYRLLQGMRLLLEFRASTDKDTVVNLSNHAYFNLSADEDTAKNHFVRLHADQYVPVSDSLVPTGGINPVDGSPYDFRDATLLEKRLGGLAGFDHSFLINGQAGILRPAAELWSPSSGLHLEVQTTQPAVHFYTGHYLHSPFRAYQGVCLETQNLPDAPNQANFPSAVLRPGEEYCHQTLYSFSMRE